VTLNGTQAASPVNGQIASTITINEEGVVTIIGSFRDPGVLDTETVSINWNDPGVPPQLVTAVRDPNDPTIWTFTASHQYVRDNPGGIYMPVRDIAITATDKDGGTTTVDAKITIAHVNLIIDDLSLSPSAIVTGTAVKGHVVVLTGHITDIGLHPISDIVIDWGDGSAPSTLASADVTYDPLTNTFTAEHQYLNPGAAGVYVDLIKVSAFDDDTGFASADIPIKFKVVPPIESTLVPPIDFALLVAPPIPQTPLGGPVVLEGTPFVFQSTVFIPIDVPSGGRPVWPLNVAQGAPIDLPLNLADLGPDLSRIDIDWGDGNIQTLDDPGSGSIDVAHAYSHIVGDDEIATGTLSPDADHDNGRTEVVVRAYRKGADGRDELKSITRYRIEVDGMSPHVDGFSFHRVGGTNGDVDTVSGRISYRGLPSSVAVAVVWSDGTTSDGAIEMRDGECWFSATHNYAGEAPVALVGLRFINTANSRILGSFEIKPRPSTGLDPVAPTPAPASGQRHGDAGPAQRMNRALALHTPGSSAMTKSDIALMFGAGTLGVAARPSLWLDRSLAKAIRRQPAPPPGLAPKGTPVAVANSAWLAAPYRVSGDDLGGWHEVDDWLMASDHGTRPATDATDWLIVRE
jgi:hypothetical protein